jgi:hypothetical protein
MLTKQFNELNRQADVVTVSKGKRGRPKGSYSKGAAAREYRENKQADVVITRVNVADLKPGHSVFGNKGNVWNDTAHIYKHGEGNLCGTPALSSNWASIEGVQTIGCPRCLERYK